MLKTVLQVEKRILGSNLKSKREINPNRYNIFEIKTIDHNSLGDAECFSD